jgi:hypothetical protein
MHDGPGENASLSQIAKNGIVDILKTSGMTEAVNYGIAKRAVAKGGDEKEVDGRHSMKSGDEKEVGGIAMASKKMGEDGRHSMKSRDEKEVGGVAMASKKRAQRDIVWANKEASTQTPEGWNVGVSVDAHSKTSGPDGGPDSQSKKSNPGKLNGIENGVLSDLEVANAIGSDDDNLDEDGVFSGNKTVKQGGERGKKKKKNFEPPAYWVPSLLSFHVVFFPFSKLNFNHCVFLKFGLMKSGHGDKSKSQLYSARQLYILIHEIYSAKVKSDAAERNEGVFCR